MLIWWLYSQLKFSVWVLWDTTSGPSINDDPIFLLQDVNAQPRCQTSSKHATLIKICFCPLHRLWVYWCSSVRQYGLASLISAVGGCSSCLWALSSQQSYGSSSTFWAWYPAFLDHGFSLWVLLMFTVVRWWSRRTDSRRKGSFSPLFFRIHVTYKMFGSKGFFFFRS